MVILEAEDLALGVAEVVVVAGDERGHLADAEDVCAEGADLGCDVAVCAVDERHDEDHGGDADDDSKQGEHGTQLVGPQRAEGEAESVFFFHRHECR